ncbi:MAG: VTT domain-containing protein [Henriciella sp.]
MKSFPRWLKWLSFVIIFLTTIAIPFALLEGPAEAWGAAALEWSGERPGSIAVLVIGALTADVLLPVPNGLTNTLAGAVLGWGTASVVIWIGLMLGCLFGYGVGRFAGRPIAERLVGADDLVAAEDLASRISVTGLIVSRPVPMFAELATLSAGLTRLPIATFLLATAIANIGVAVVFAGLGAAALNSGSATLAYVGVAVLPAVCWLAYRAFNRERGQARKSRRDSFENEE